MLPFAKMVGSEDDVGLPKWMRTSRAEDIYSLVMVIRPPEFEEYGKEPRGHDANANLQHAQMIFGATFARRNHRPARIGAFAYESPRSWLGTWWSGRDIRRSCS